MNRKQFVIASLFALVLLTVAFTPISSQQGVHDYDPWVDLNDDGKIDGRDIAGISAKFGTLGDPVNKTQLLLQVNATYASLLSRIDALNATMRQADASLLSQIAYLNARMVLFNSKFVSDAATTETLNYVDIGDLYTSLTLSMESALLIMFSTDANATAGPVNSNVELWVRAVINDSIYPNPGATGVQLTPDLGETGWALLPTHSHSLGFASYSYIFYQPSLSPGTYTTKIQFKVNWATGYLKSATLTVIALPYE